MKHKLGITYRCAFEPVALNVHIIYLNRFQTRKTATTQKICTKLISTCWFLYVSVQIELNSHGY